ncbi:MAG: methylated-DNA--[protein]-cysteine S-methyltransferase [Opitutaceae bacterium]|nr:methylated-DNA--[protein]-cysteine S-methyltransferase [Opitutaceae bacterium]
MPHLSFPTVIGPCGLAWNDAGLTAFNLPGSDRPDPGEAAARLAEAPAWIRGLVARVQRHLAGELQDFTAVPLDYGAVSSFARRVYEATRQVPAGHTRTYGDLAGTLEEPPGTSRAIGAVLGANPWSLIVPCHRILGAKGRLTGFSAAGGVRTKARLLAIEGAQLLAE